MDDQALSDAIQNFGQWPLLGIILIAMLRFWRRSDDSFVGIIAELRKSLEGERDARVKDKIEYDREINEIKLTFLSEKNEWAKTKQDNETEIKALKARILQLETLLHGTFGGGASA